MSQVPDPEHVNFFLEHLGKFLGATAGALLLAMQYISRSKKAAVARAVLTETPVSHAELTELELEMTKTISTQFRDLRKELLEEIKDIYKYINSQNSQNIQRD